jgi:hypothetical protein
MEWIIKIEGKEVDIVANKKLPISNQRILVKYIPQKDEIKFIGQFKPHNKEWVDFCEVSFSTEIDLDKIQELLYRTYKKLNERVQTYLNIAEGFDVIKLIEIPDEEE